MNQAFIFDVFGTLLDWRTGVATQLKHAFEMRSLSIDPLAFSDYWRALYGPAMDRVRSGSRGYVRLEELHRENLDETLLAFGIGDAFDHQAREDLSSAWEPSAAMAGRLRGDGTSSTARFSCTLLECLDRDVSSDGPVRRLQVGCNLRCRTGTGL